MKIPILRGMTRTSQQITTEKIEAGMRKTPCAWFPDDGILPNQEFIDEKERVMCNLRSLK